MLSLYVLIAKLSTVIVFVVVVVVLLLKMYFSLPQLPVFLFDVLSVAVFVIRERFVKKKKNLACV